MSHPSDFSTSSSSTTSTSTSTTSAIAAKAKAIVQDVKHLFSHHKEKDTEHRSLETEPNLIVEKEITKTEVVMPGIEQSAKQFHNAPLDSAIPASKDSMAEKQIDRDLKSGMMDLNPSLIQKPLESKYELMTFENDRLSKDYMTRMNKLRGYLNLEQEKYRYKHREAKIPQRRFLRTDLSKIKKSGEERKTEMPLSHELHPRHTDDLPIVQNPIIDETSTTTSTTAAVSAKASELAAPVISAAHTVSDKAKLMVENVKQYFADRKDKKETEDDRLAREREERWFGKRTEAEPEQRVFDDLTTTSQRQGN